MTYMTRFKTLMGLSLAMVLAACGGGGGGGDDAAAGKPLAQISASATSVEAGTAVSFDGSRSSTPNGGTLTYQWALIGRPDGSTAALTTPTASNSTLTPDKAGEYTVSLVTKDSVASSDPAQVKVTVTAPPQPVAVIRPVSGALVGLPVQLDGSTSQPPSGGSAGGLSYVWTLLEKPGDSTAEFDDPANVYPRFTADKEGSYKVRLVVHYGELVSAAVESTVDAYTQAAPPTALPKVTTATPVRGQVVQLDASESSDPEGQPLKYFWRFGLKDFGQPYPVTGRPVGSNAVIENPNSATPSFVPDIPGTYSLWLMVYNGKRYSTNAVTVTVAKSTDTPNTAPVAAIVAGRPSYTFENEPSIGSAVSLDSSYSYDVDGDALTVEWQWVSTPDGFDKATNSTFTTTRDGWSSSFKPTHVGNYVAKLRVHDGTVWSDWTEATWKVLTGANVAPTATVKTAVGARQTQVGGRTLLATTQVGAKVLLDGSASIGGNGDRVFYTWEMLYRPEGSRAVLSDIGATYPEFTADQEGPYLVRLRVKDAFDALSRSYAEILIVARINNSPPVLRPSWGAVSEGTHSEEQPVLLGTADNKRFTTRFYLASNALDPDGDDVDTLISLVDAPAGGMPETQQWTVTGAGGIESTSSTGFLPKVSGTYTFQLIGSDSVDKSALHVVKVPMATVADYPSLLLRSGGGGANFPLWTFENSTFTHVLFPAERSTDSFAASWQTWSYRTGSPDTEGWIDQLKLNAPVGQSYTIVDLKAESEDPAVPANFIGLTEGQVIAAGSSLEFTLNVKRWSEDRTDDNPATPYPKARWSFRIKERPEWTFSEEATLQGKWYEATAPSPDP